MLRESGCGDAHADGSPGSGLWCSGQCDAHPAFSVRENYTATTECDASPSAHTVPPCSIHSDWDSDLLEY